MLQESKPLKFQKSKDGEFYTTVKQRVDDFFKQNQITRNATLMMHLKILLFFSLYFLLIGAIYSNKLVGSSLILCYATLGFVTSLICCNFCHDVIHGSYFSSPKVNRLFGYIYDVNGLSSCLWKITHNLRHHTYTNIAGFDEDIDKAILLRLSPKDEIYTFHRYQQLYAFPLYLLSSLNWAYYTDCKYLIDEAKKGNVPKAEIVIFVTLKILNILIFLALPLLLLSAPWWQIVVGFLCMHFVGGFFSAIVFQLAHVVENVAFPQPDDEGNIPTIWAIHEMQTTSNFATNNQFCCWLTGGLNHQIEHHLFPYICHIHYPEISSIVKQTAKEFNVPYHEQPTFLKAMLSHYNTLKRFGRE